MTRHKWLQLTPVIAAVTSFSVTAVAQTTPQPTPETAPEQTTQPATPEPAQATPPPSAPPPVTTAPPAPAAEEEKLPPGSFKIPGTRTTLTLSGYAQMDVTYDFRGRDPNIEGNDWAVHAANIPLNSSYESQEKTNQLYLTARTSRIGFSTKTESDVGNIGVNVEGDFNVGNLLSGQTFSNSVLFRLRHAYGTWSGKYGTLLVGQSWSTFLDLPSYSETVDFNGPGSIPLIRQPQVRYTIPIGGGVIAALAAENAPGTDLNGITDNGVGPRRPQQTIPDLLAVLGASGGWGSASIGAVTMQYKNASLPATATNPAAPSYVKQGWGARAAAAIKLPWGDTFRAYVAGGNGIGRYLFNAASAGQSATADDANATFQLWESIAYHANYTHVWSPMLRSNVVWSQTFNGNNHTVSYSGADASAPNQNQRIDQLFINTFITVTKQMEFGFEYAFSERRTFGLSNDNAGQPCGSGAGCQQIGTQHRAGMSAHYNFF